MEPARNCPLPDTSGGRSRSLFVSAGGYFLMAANTR